MEDPLKVYNDVLKISGGDEADNYPQKQQMSQADWNDDLDYMRKTFGGANDEIEEEDGLDEDRVEIDIGGDDVEIEDFDDEEESEEFTDQGGDNEPEMEAEWKEVEKITKESYSEEGLYEDYIEMFPEDKWRTGGGFGQALKDNDLVRAYQRADLGNRDRLSQITGKSDDELYQIAYGDESYASEEDGTDFDNDGDIDSKDYLEAKDRAIKKSIDEESYASEDEYPHPDYKRDPDNFYKDGTPKTHMSIPEIYNFIMSNFSLDHYDKWVEPEYGKSVYEESYASEYEDPIYEFNCSICGFNGIEENNNDLLENHYRDTHNITWDNNPQQLSNAMRYELERMNPDDTEEQMIQDWDNPTW